MCVDYTHADCSVVCLSLLTNTPVPVHLFVEVNSVFIYFPANYKLCSALSWTQDYKRDNCGDFSMAAT